jgi:ribulose 1,5-bisphosphate carboxylase large subunit-like protein
MAKPLGEETLKNLWHDWDRREDCLREVVEDRLRENAPPEQDGQIVATYFLALRSTTLSQAAESIAYHATSGTKNPPPGSLIEECTATAVRVEPFEASERIGLLHVAIPLKMLCQPDGHLTSCDILHTVAGAALFDMYENLDARLVSLKIPPTTLATFPGPAYGPEGIRRMTRFAPNSPAFGTILKPTAGIVPETVGELVAEAAKCPLFMFVKEDENLYPHLDYSPVAQRTRLAVESIHRVKQETGGADLLFAPHITGAPHELPNTVREVVEQGAKGVMLSETFAGGAYRLVREATRDLDHPPAIYGHNAGIGVKTHCIWREVVDFLARLDGIDFRQTAPVGPDVPFIRPYGKEWEASERVLSEPIENIRPTTIVRAGGLDQGNIGLNLADVERRGLGNSVLFLAGSAINSIKDKQGKANPQIGAEAMTQAVEVYYSGALRDAHSSKHVAALKDHAKSKGLASLQAALAQRYPG